jgi:hypothetical protein
MGWNDHLEDDGGFNDFLQALVDRSMLEGAALGITKVVIDKGVGALTPKQLYVFNEHVIGQYSRSGCSNCQIDIPWSEMRYAMDNGGLCSYCAHKIESKDE